MKILSQFLHFMAKQFYPHKFLENNLRHKYPFGSPICQVSKSKNLEFCFLEQLWAMSNNLPQVRYQGSVCLVRGELKRMVACHILANLKCWQVQCWLQQDLRNSLGSNSTIATVLRSMQQLCRCKPRSFQIGLSVFSSKIWTWHDKNK